MLSILAQRVRFDGGELDKWQVYALADDRDADEEIRRPVLDFCCSVGGFSHGGWLRLAISMLAMVAIGDARRIAK